ncbi:hypothetical protein [Halopiger aswanensis]|uniref:DUF2064 domain-containing protein n=1 Tax=Halopiger aswanensis TaxID=148449 RepID=A0A3R7DBF0_9EURY|nr:hypothetical protein [Halopiger aswanensis]RKD97251.1 hypothetical protein ATJ93_0235 [Halopiger aswanensis]
MIVVVPVDPPRGGLVLPSLVETTPLTAAEAVSLYEAAVADVLYTVASSGGDLLVNYRDEETLPDEFTGPEFDDPETEIRELTAAALEDTGDVRFERQVGSSHSARIGNTVTHLLEREDAGSVGVLEPTAPLVSRSEIDSAAMSLRRYDAILGPSTGGRAYFAGFTAPIDFADAYATPALATLADRSESAGLKLGFAPMVPDVRSESGLCATIAGLEARQAAERPSAAATAAVVDELGLVVGDGDSLERR